MFENSSTPLLLRLDELCSGGIAGGVEQHEAGRVGVLAGTSGDGECGVGAIIEEFSLDGDFAASELGGDVDPTLGLAGYDCVDAVSRCRCRPAACRRR